MTVRRRTCLMGAALTAGATLLPTRAVATPRGPRQPAAFRPGGVRPQGRLATTTFPRTVQFADNGTADHGWRLL
jgi:hypothetical protein